MARLVEAIDALFMKPTAPIFIILSACLIAGAMVAAAGLFAALPRDGGPPQPVVTNAAPMASSPAAPVTSPPRSIPAPPSNPNDPAIQDAVESTVALEAMDDDARTAFLAAWVSADEIPSYGQLERAPLDYLGHRTRFRGRVEEIQDADDASLLRVSTRYGDNIVWVQTVVRAPRWVERGSRVVVYGVIMQPVSYTSQAGWRITLPGVVAVAIQRP